MSYLLIDSRLKSKIEDLMEWQEDVCSVKFNDLDDTFWFNNKIELNEFIKNQESERFYDKSLRKGYFDYVNDANEVLRYYVESKRGTLKVIREENLGQVS